MKKRLFTLFAVCLLVCTIPAAWAEGAGAASATVPASTPVASTASDKDCKTCADTWVQVMVFVPVIGFLLLSLSAVKSSLKSSDWTLAHALSEESEQITSTTDGKTTQTVMVGSASRLIAFMGMLVIMAFFIGVGLWLLWRLLASGSVPPDLDKLLNFFYGGLVLFAPYLANQIKGALTTFGK